VKAKVEEMFGARGIARKPSKYKNTRVEFDGQKFDSKRELVRYQELLLLQRAGKIAELRRQVSFPLSPAVVIQGRKRPALRYVADFVYQSLTPDAVVVEDVKGRITEGYRIKRHLMAALGIEIREVK
jgi:hypothetical protein